MKFKLENPQHQITAIRSVVKVFRGMERNTYDNAHIDDIHSNVCSLSQQELMDNIKRVITEKPATQSGITESNLPRSLTSRKKWETSSLHSN